MLDDETASRERQIEQAVRDAVEGNRVTLHQRRHANGFAIEVIPANPAAAKIGIRTDGDWIDLGIGQGTVLEIGPKGQQYTELSAIDELRAICDAVVAGRFREDLWIRNGNVLKTNAQIVVADRVIKLRYRLLWNIDPFHRTFRKHVQYAPY
jgi:hypothetical protein